VTKVAEASMPEVTFFGHGAVGITASDGTTLVVDPFESGGFDGRIGYRPIPVEPEYVLCTHDHADHSAIEALPGARPMVVDEGRAGAFDVSRHRFAHDEYDGCRFGGHVDATVIRVDQHTIVHASDIGQSPGASLPSALRRPDLMFVPVGGFYTVGAAQALEWCRRLAPRITVPIHYRTPACGLPLRGLDPLVSHLDRVVSLEQSAIELGRGLARLHGSIVVLEPACRDQSA
jgi:L-ascorbate metabolism protein UlaG (beta-lactamase superfamily)